MKASIKKTFRKTAAAAYASFPQELKGLVILLVPSDTPVYVSPEIAEHLTKSTSAVKSAVKDAAKAMHTRNLVGFVYRDYDLAGTPVNIIALDKKAERDVSPLNTEEMQLVFDLDHEIGHHVLKNGDGSIPGVPQQLAESVADAYAMLRHIQSFGKDTHFARDYAAAGAMRAVLCADTDHYTSDAVERVIRMSKETDISGLSLRETAVLAEQIADECCLDKRTLGKIRKAFRPVQEVYKPADIDFERICRATISVMREHRNDPDIFEAGKRALSDHATKKRMVKSAKNNHYWEEALAFIDNPKAKPQRRPTASKSLRGPG